MNLYLLGIYCERYTWFVSVKEEYLQTFGVLCERNTEQNIHTYEKITR